MATLRGPSMGAGRRAGWRAGRVEDRLAAGRLELALDPARLPADLAARMGEYRPEPDVAVVDHDPTPSRRFVTRAISSPRSSRTPTRPAPRPAPAGSTSRPDSTAPTRSAPTCWWWSRAGSRRGCGGGSGRGPERATRRAGARRSSQGARRCSTWGTSGCGAGWGRCMGGLGCGRGGGEGPCSAFGMPSCSLRRREPERSTVADEDGLIIILNCQEERCTSGDRLPTSGDCVRSFVGTYVGQNGLLGGQTSKPKKLEALQGKRALGPFRRRASRGRRSTRSCSAR